MDNERIIRPGDKSRTSERLWKNCLKNRFLRACLLLSLGMMMQAGNAFAHHGGAEYDTKSTTTLEGTVTEFRFVNPHVQILFDTNDEKGNVLHWSCEAPDPAMLVRQGWSRKTLEPGDRVTFLGHPAKSGAKVIVLQKITLPDGRVMEAKGAAQ